MMFNTECKSFCKFLVLSIIVLIFFSAVSHAEIEAVATWMSGSDTRNQPGVYGSIGIADPNNVPGGRNGSVSRIDNSGDLWLFGGNGRDSNSDLGKLNDLWKYDGDDWTWIGGANTIDQNGIYGIKNVAGPNNVPGARVSSVCWTDIADNLWLFGGFGRTGTGSNGNLNDLWFYDGNMWIWINGSDTINQTGIYGTKGLAGTSNVPGGRQLRNSWVDNTGNLWLFGGYGFDSTSSIGNLNDLWKFNGNKWTWVSGANTVNQAGVYGIKGVGGTANVPGARSNGVSWTDSLGKFWLFGGWGYDSASSLGYLNDLWKFNGSVWTWISGSDVVAQAGIYGIKGVGGTSNVPGARQGSACWVDSDGDFWILGGYGRDSNSVYGRLNDLWKFNGAAWTWISGSDQIDQTGVYGTKGVAEPGNIVGARSGSLSWIDSLGNFWLFEGTGRDSNGDFGYLNDLWRMQIYVYDIHYVDDSAVGIDNGTSWANAFNNLYDALAAAQPGDKIWVAEGIYLPDTNGLSEPRDASFMLKNEVAIYGGFLGNETSLALRNPQINETVLSGNIGAIATNSDNSYHVFYHPVASNLDPNAILDGFTITGGNADGVDTDGYGAGMISYNSDPTIINCIFTQNSAAAYGAGMRNFSSSPTVTNCIFIDNYGGLGGAGIFNTNSSNPTVTNCSFIGNSAGSYGGGMRNYSSNPIVTNCIFAGNSAGLFGGGMFNTTNGNPTVTGCTFTNNSSGHGGAIYGSASIIIVSNCILWGNTASADGNDIALVNSSTIDINYCDIQGGLADIYDASGSVVNWGVGNIDSNPLFADADGDDNTPGTEDDNLRLSLSSLCIDTGDNSAVTESIDLDGLTRIVDGDCNTVSTVDMGAYEFDKLYIADFDCDCDVDFGDFAILALSWLLDNPAIDIAPYLEADGIIDWKELLVMANHWLEGTAP